MNDICDKKGMVRSYRESDVATCNVDGGRPNVLAARRAGARAWVCDDRPMGMVCASQSEGVEAGQSKRTVEVCRCV